MLSIAIGSICPNVKVSDEICETSGIYNRAELGNYPGIQDLNMQSCVLNGQDTELL